MIIKPSALPQHKTLYPLYVVAGNEPYLCEQAAQDIITKVIAQYHSEQSEGSPASQEVLHPLEKKQIHIQHSSDWTMVFEAANTYALFSDHTLLDIRFDKKTLDTTIKSTLLSYLASPNPHCTMVIRAPNLNLKAHNWLTAESSVAWVQVQAFTMVQMQQWIVEQLKQIGSFEADVPRVLYQHTQGNLHAAAAFIEKLKLTFDPTTPLTVAEVEAQIIDQSEYALFDLIEMMLTGNLTQARRLLRHAREQRVEPNLVLWIILQEVRLLINLQQAMKQNRSMRDACSHYKVWSSRVNYYQQAIQRLPEKILLQVISQGRQIDELIKTTTHALVWPQLERIVGILCIPSPAKVLLGLGP